MVFPWTKIVDDEWDTKGATVPHLTMWFDAANVEAAAYVALSRVEYDRNWRFVGNPIVHHCTPSKNVLVFGGACNREPKGRAPGGGLEPQSAPFSGLSS
eukprot:1744398-Amphidinium_carterae.2